MSIVARALKYRLNVSEELQGWILVFASITCIFLYCLPCYCAGLSWHGYRKFAVWLNKRLPSFYLWMTLFNGTMMFLIVTWLPDWSFVEYLQFVLQKSLDFIGGVLSCVNSIVVVIAFCIALAFKDRLMQLVGLDHQTIFRFKIRDCFSCGASRFRPIELLIWKVEDLQSDDIFTANNIFVEAYLGYNEPMKTRVHNNAGNGCLLKEVLQLNFDEDDEEETLHLFVKNQKVLGTSELARTEIPTDRLRAMVHRSRDHRGEMVRWSEEMFEESFSLMPRGRLWIKARPIRDESREPFMREFLTC